MNILKENKEPLLSRVMYELKIDHTGKSTPKQDSLTNELCSLLKTNPECLVIKHIYTKSGSSISKIICYSYLNKESKEKIEGKKKEKKGKEDAKKESKEQKTK